MWPFGSLISESRLQLKVGLLLLHSAQAGPENGCAQALAWSSTLGCDAAVPVSRPRNQASGSIAVAGAIAKTGRLVRKVPAATIRAR